LRQAVRLYSEKHNVDWPNVFERTRDRGSRYEIALATLHLHAVPLHGAKVWATGEERDIESGLSHAGANVGSDCSSTRNQESHGRPFMSRPFMTDLS
jgi:hypothetical protein